MLTPIFTAAAQRQQPFSGTQASPTSKDDKSNNNLKNNDDLEPLTVSSGQASITLKGSWTEANDLHDKREEEEQSPSSLFKVPVVIEMPPIDDDDDDENSTALLFVEKWHKLPGDFLEKDDVICEIATPEFSFGIQIDDEEKGLMGEIHAKEGMRVPSHTPLCTIYHKEDED